jgi:phage repressor protein C with HTH and peptisase S24 domain
MYSSFLSQRSLENMNSVSLSSLKEPLDIGSRIAQVRFPLPQAKFADSLGIHKNTLIRYEKGERLPDSSLLLRICERYDVDPGWLLTGNPRDLFAGENIAILDEYIPIPCRSTSLDNSGLGNSGTEEPIAIKKSWIFKQLQAKPEDLSFFYAEGESMKPTLYPGDIVLVNLHQAAIRDGLYVLQIEDVILIKRLQRLSGDLIKVSSDNSEYESWTANIHNLSQTLKIVGKVVRICQKL